MSEERKKRVEKSRDPKVWKKWLEECVVTSSEVEQNDDSEDDEVLKSDHESISEQQTRVIGRMNNPVNEFDAHSDNEEDSGSGSDEESNDSSDEELESGEEESEDGEDVEGFGADGNVDNILSDDSTDERERCPICLNRFVGQDLGTPESCEHTFCFECIQEWSKNINTCPIDRTEFNNIRVRATPDGNDIRRVKVKVRPKEAENSPEESVTLCEVCHNGDREDRLLLCDGCDVAYHCECLDPPLFYIPIEEWFCPPCSGILQNRAVAGPSQSRARRVIPRTRASEAVRSRVQNLRRTQKSPAPRSTSSVSRKSTTPVKRKRRRTYRKFYKKVVQLARTKQSMSGVGKGKMAARGATVVVTYRRRRRRRRKRLSKRSMASSKALSGPSAQQRIAKRLGISKSFDGSTMPQIKKPTSVGRRLGSRADKMPSHSLFGNKDQLMDFSENFNEIDINTPSTSRGVSVNRRSFENNASSVFTPVNILDSIMAGQTLLHSKSDNVVIKTDGSLVMKTSNTDTKKVKVIKKSEVGQSSRTPMRVALVKEGAKPLILEKLLKKKNNEKNNTKESNCCSELSKSHSLKTSSSQSRRLSHIMTSTINSSNHKSSSKNKDFKLFDDWNNKKNTLATFKIPKKVPEECKENKRSSLSNVKDLSSIPDNFQSDVPSDWESELCNPVNSVAVKDRTSSMAIKKGNKSKYKNKESGYSINSTNLNLIDKLDRYNTSSQNLASYESSSVNVSNSSACTYIKKEVVSDQNSDSNILCKNTEVVHIKQEILSDEETNADSWILNSVDITKQKSEKNCNVNIKKEFVDSDSDINASTQCNFGSKNIDDASGSENSDYDASQSIIDSVPSTSIYSSQYDKWKSKTPHIKIKEEIPSDPEDCSQSLVSNIGVNLESESFSHNTFLARSSQLKTKNAQISSELSDSSNGSLPCTQIEPYPVLNDRRTPDYTASNTKNNDSPHSVVELCSTQFSLSKYDSSENKKLTKMQDVSSFERNIQASDCNFPTEINCASESSKESSSDESDNELPSTQINPACPNLFSNSSISQGNIQKNVSLNSQNELFSGERLPDQINNSSVLSNKGMTNRIFSNQSAQSKEIMDIPETQAEPEMSEILPATQILSAPREVSNLPNTQIDKSSTSSERPIIWTSISGKNSPNKSASGVLAVNKKSSILVNQRSCSVSGKVVKVLETKVNEPVPLSATQILDESSNDSFVSPSPEIFTSVNELSDLPATQLCSENVVESFLHVTHIFDETSRNPSLPDTQISDSTFKELPSLPATQIDDATFKQLSLPATQIFDTTFKDPSTSPATQVIDATFKEPSLPATQIIDPIFKKPSNLNAAQIFHEPLESSTLPATQIFDTTVKELSTLPETQMPDETLTESSTLSATQMVEPSLSEVGENSKNKANSSGNFISDLSSSPQNQVQNKTSNKSITEIISNIKQIVNSLTKSSSDASFLKCQGDTNEVELAPDYDKGSVNSELKKPANASTNDLMSKNELHKENSNASNENIEKNNNSTDSEDEELSPEKLKEILSKSGKVDSPKNVGVHRHLPQVITVKPVKQLLKPKPPNRKTFSFEEVAKIEGPFTSKDYNLSKTNLDNFCIENDDLPATQLAAWPQSNLSETQIILNGVNNDILGDNVSSFSNESLILKTGIRTKKMSPKIQNGKQSFATGCDQYELPATQACSLNGNKSLKQNKNTKELIELSDTNEISLPATQIFSSTIENNFQLNKYKRDVMILSDDESSLYATQVFNFRDENNFLKPLPKIKKEKILSDRDVNNLSATDINDFREGNKKSNILSESHTDVFNCPAQKDQESLNLVNSVDLPATQLFSETLVQPSNKFEQSSIYNGKNVSKSCLSVKNKNHQNSGESPVTEKSKHSRQCIESRDYSKSTSKKECSSNDHISDSKKPSKNHVSKYFDAEKDASNKGHKRDSNISNNSEQEGKKMKKSKSHTLTVSHIKLNPSDNEESFSSKGRRENIEKRVAYSTEEKLSNINVKKEPETVSNLKNMPSIKIKQEKIDVHKIISEEPFGDRFLPSTQIVNFNTFENDSLPPTQIFCDQATANNNTTSNSNHESDHELEILSPMQIKKEVLSDDEVSIIELKCESEVSVKKEIISIDDDLENTDFGKSTLHSSSNSYRKDIAIKVERDAKHSKPCTKKDETVKNIFKNASNSKQNKRAAIGDENLKDSIDSISKGQSKCDGKSSEFKEKVSRNSFREVEKEKHSAGNRLSKESNKSRHISETSKSSKNGISNNCEDLKKYKSSKDHTVSKISGKKHDSDLSKLKCKKNYSKSTSTDVGKHKCSTDSITSQKEKKTKCINELLKSKSKCEGFENNSNGFKKLKISKDSAPIKEDRYQKHEMDSKSKSKNFKDAETTNNSKPPSKRVNTYEKHKTDSYSESKNMKSDKLSSYQKDADKLNHLKFHKETNCSPGKERLSRSSSEKENDNYFKTNHSAIEMLITVKPSSRKRSQESSNRTNQKKFKSDESSNSTSFSEDLSSHLSALQNGLHKDRVKTSSVSSMDWNDSIHDFPEKESPGTDMKRDMKVISRKQELKEEIANEVKLVLKPFYSTSLISKEDYKDIMRRAVPKIFMNCHNCINPDKIRKLVLSYVSLLNKS